MNMMLWAFGVLAASIFSFALCQIGFDASVERDNSSGVRWYSLGGAASLGIGFISATALSVIGILSW